ncbi:MAG: hypothetical protein PHH84_04295 [Oscillospiraceae bacterium]|nr:hypothetical protein [Oscillospiraceae bacterium]MDD4414885.1 hypothetical protein [Oscillospiraceae bacterium]
MKKTITAVICVVLVTAICITASAAGLDANKQKVMDILKSSSKIDGKTISLPVDLLNQAENYLRRDDVTITAEQADAVVGYVKEAHKIIEDAGALKVESLSSTEIANLLDKIRKAAAVVGLTVETDSARNIISILADGVLVASDEPALKVTGPDTTSLVVFAGIGLVLLAGCFVAARKAKLFER